MTCAITVYGCEPDEAAAFEAIGARYGITPTVTAAALSEATAGLAIGHRCVSISHKAAVPNPALLALSRVGVRYLSTRSIGLDHLDIGYADQVGIQIGNVAYSPASVADYTLMLILMAIRNMRSVLRRTDNHDYRLHEPAGRELRDLTIGVIGTGRIGAAVIDRLGGFGARVVAHDLHRSTAARYVGLDELLRLSDVVTLHTPLTAATHHLLDRGRIELLKPDAYVINTGRGPLLDTAALATALETGRLAGAALDVLEGEGGVFYAYRPDQPVNSALARLQRLPNVILSPHTAYHTDHARTDIVENTIVNCLAFEKENAAWTGSR